MARQLLTQPSTTEGILWGHVFYCLVPCATRVQHTADTYLTSTSAVRVMDIFHNWFFSLLWSLLEFLKMFPFHLKALILGKKPQTNHKLGDSEENWEMMFYHQNMECFGEEWEHLVPNFQLLPGTQQTDRIKAGFHLGKPHFLQIPPKTLNFSVSSVRATTSSLLLSI